ncbi:MAG: PEP-CTERM sorting domain-containing protein [Planctomycetes bacterium]|nr:PEP-CTERM sorting domain-containing protein [Planctomycetota bacterium]
MNQLSILGGGFLSVRMLTVLLTCTTVVSLANVAEANIVWEWSFTDQGRPPGTEAGRFLTDGNLAGNAAPAATYNVIDFEVIQSDYGNPIGSILGGQYNEGNQPGTGFDWDGAADTLWFRAGGTLTNGANYYPTTRGSPPGTYLFFPGSYSVETGPSSTTLTLVPIPEPATLWLLAAGAIPALRRRRGRPHCLHPSSN